MPQLLQLAVTHLSFTQFVRVGKRVVVQAVTRQKNLIFPRVLRAVHHNGDIAGSVDPGEAMVQAVQQRSYRRGTEAQQGTAWHAGPFLDEAQLAVVTKALEVCEHRAVVAPEVGGGQVWPGITRFRLRAKHLDPPDAQAELALVRRAEMVPGTLGFGQPDRQDQAAAGLNGRRWDAKGRHERSRR